MTTKKTKPRVWPMLAAVVTLLIAWRLFLVGLDASSMWFDEDYSWRISREGPIALIESTAQDVHPPTYYLLLWGWMRVTASESLFIMRLNSAIPMLLAVAVTYRLGRMWFGSAWVAFGSALYMGGMAMTIFYARNLRMYALIVLLLALSWWAFTRVVQGRKWSAVVYGLSLAAMAYTFYFAAFGVLSQVIVAALFFRQQWRRWLTAYAVALVAFAPWLPVFINQIAIARAQSADPNAVAVGKFLGTIPTGEGSLLTFVKLYTYKQPAYVGLLMVLGLLHGWRLRRSWTAAAALWAFFTVVFLFTLNLAIPVYSHRYTVIIAPSVALLAGLALDALPRPRYRLALAGVMVAAAALSYNAAVPEQNTPHREMFATINAGYQAGDVVWYNMNTGAYGSTLYGTPAEFHLYADAPRLNPDGSAFVWEAPREFDDPATAPRVWDARPLYVDYPADTGEVMRRGRALTAYYAYENEHFVRLYEAPPTDAPVLLGDVFALRSSGTTMPTFGAGDDVPVKLWWTAREDVTLDYSRALQLRNSAGDVVVQSDDALALWATMDAPPVPSSAWPVDEVAFSRDVFTLPDELPSGAYTLWLSVYYWESPDAPLMPADADSEPFVRVATFHVE